CPLTHEMNLATLTIEEWRDVIADVENRLRRYPTGPALYDQIAAAARAKCETHIERVDWDGEALSVNLDGRAEVDVNLDVYQDEGDSGCVNRSAAVAPFNGHTK